MDITVPLGPSLTAWDRHICKSKRMMVCNAVQYLLQTFSLNVLLYQSHQYNNQCKKSVIDHTFNANGFYYSCTAICPIKTKLAGSHFKEGIMKAALNNKLLLTQQKFWDADPLSLLIILNCFNYSHFRHCSFYLFIFWLLFMIWCLTWLTKTWRKKLPLQWHRTHIYMTLVSHPQCLPSDWFQQTITTL